MGRIAAVNRLTPEQHATVDAVLLHSRFSDLNGMVAELERRGVVVSRSSLHRYAAKLRAGQAVRPVNTGSVFVSIVDTRTMQTELVTLNAPVAAISAHLQRLNLPSE